MDIRDENISYWNQRAEGYAHINEAQLTGDHAQNWAQALIEPIVAAWPEREPESLRVLDIGCGPGIFSILLGEHGFRTTAADYTPHMLDQARRNVHAHGLDELIDVVAADAENLPFEDGSFHAVVSRNLTWNLPHPERAYEEWARVLVPGGIIVNFDANWYLHLANREARRAYEHDREECSMRGIEEACEIEGYEHMEEIARHVPLTTTVRPGWDLHVLRRLGLHATVTPDIWKRVWDSAERANFASTPLFRIVARN